MERFGDTDEPVIALGPKGEVDGIWYVLLVICCHHRIFADIPGISIASLES